MNCQRWRERKAFFRKPDEQIKTSEYNVATIADGVAKAFVTTHHYSGSYPAARFRFGLFRYGELVGVAVFGHPASDRVLTNVFGGKATDSVELSRLVLLDEVPGNGESWFIGRCLKALREQERVRGVLAFSDPVPRTRLDGTVVMPGHVGTVYQATNAAIRGRGKARTLRVLPDATVFSDRAAQKVRTLEQGWEYAVRMLVRHGAEHSPYLVQSEQHRREWLSAALAAVARPMRHPGNHRYVWCLRGERLLSTGPYPKKGNL